MRSHCHYNLTQKFKMNTTPLLVENMSGSTNERFPPTPICCEYNYLECAACWCNQVKNATVLGSAPIRSAFTVVTHGKKSEEDRKNIEKLTDAMNDQSCFAHWIANLSPLCPCLLICPCTNKEQNVEIQRLRKEMNTETRTDTVNYTVGFIYYKHMER